MKKVLCVGCSFTLGEELQNPKESSYPSLLQKMNNWDVINKGQKGGSNDRNIRIVFEEIKNRYDLVIVAWTLTTRKEWYDLKNNQFIDVSVVNDRGNSQSQWYFKYNFHDEHEQTRWLTQVIGLQSFFKQINQSYLFCNTFDPSPHVTNHELVSFVDTDNYVDWPNSMQTWVRDCPHGIGMHPLEKGHMQIANQISNFLLNRK